MTKTDEKDFKNSAKCWICDHVYVRGNAKVRDHFYVTRKYRD